MKIDIETLKDSFQLGHDSYFESRQEAMKVMDMYHNRHYTSEQLAILSQRGQPPETFNIVKMFGRMLLGYYSTVINTIKVNPAQVDDIQTAAILHDLVNQTFRVNNFLSEGDKIKLDGILTGLMCSYVNVSKTGEQDEFGRPKYKIEINHIPALELVLDPMSRLDDYSDARYIHRFKWMPTEEVERQFGKGTVDSLQAYDNHTNITESQFEYTYNVRFQGRYKQFDNYLVVHTIIKDDNDKWWSIFWSGDKELSKKEITYKEVKNPYRVQKLHTSNKVEHYGVFREVFETQNAINQALLKIQLMVNTQKVFVEKTAIENLNDFTNQVNRVNAVIPVKSLAGIKVENLTREVLDQYTIIDKALDRVQRVLGINDSFLGMAYASDSGSKVKLQQNASVVALRYVTAKVESFYRLLGWDIMNLIKQYYTAHDVIRIADTYEGQKWLEINAPMQVPTGRINPQTGEPEMRLLFEEVLDPESLEPIETEDGSIVMAPIPTRDSEIAFTKADIEVDTVAYNDEDERNQVMLEQFLNGPIGNILSQVNPVGYFKAGELAVRNIKSKYSMEIGNILNETVQMLGGNPQMQQQMQQGMLPGQMSQNQAVNQQGGRPTQGGM